MEERYRTCERDYFIGTGCSDLFGRCRPSALLTFLQETATDHAIELHLSRRELMEQYHVFWMLARVWFRLDRPLRLGQTLSVRTWHRGDRGAMLYRDFDLFADGVPVGEAVSVWVLADVDTHKVRKLGDIPQACACDGGSLCKEKKLAKLRMPDELTLSEERRMHYSDTDMNGHVNNTRYADFVCDALRLEELSPERFVCAMQIGYVAECVPGETIQILTQHGPEQDYVHGVDNRGVSRFDAAIWYGNVSLPA